MAIAVSCRRVRRARSGHSGFDRLPPSTRPYNADPITNISASGSSPRVSGAPTARASPACRHLGPPRTCLPPHSHSAAPPSPALQSGLDFACLPPAPCSPGQCHRPPTPAAHCTGHPSVHPAAAAGSPKGHLAHTLIIPPHPCEPQSSHRSHRDSLPVPGVPSRRPTSFRLPAHRHPACPRPDRSSSLPPATVALGPRRAPTPSPHAAACVAIHLQTLLPSRIPISNSGPFQCHRPLTDHARSATADGVVHPGRPGPYHPATGPRRPHGALTSPHRPHTRPRLYGYPPFSRRRLMPPRPCRSLPYPPATIHLHPRPVCLGYPAPSARRRWVPHHHGTCLAPAQMLPGQLPCLPWCPRPCSLHLRC
ncbi:hypothetical protein FA95DRAFT_925561 [Auriscalpium vulgare]|uniref:Uncharacterized protein n=1 Tax=Auriscalpium vulgare TaxID=40419 RepID=A0ACB8RYJ5_9AGAM|nr:hypothetical protein FA95DRAFT_925561 [Auriscalpium vulgare]